MNLDLKTLLIIRDATRALIDHGAGHTRESFALERKNRSAILFEIVILGEGAKRLSRECRERHSEVPWSLIAGMRDRIAHSFDSINLDIVWNVVRIHAPGLLNALEEIINKESTA